jgi:CHAT domain-containing protein
LILAPYGSLHRLPLSAARDPQTGQYAADTYRLAFAPGIAALWVAWQQGQRKGQSLLSPDQALSVAYPGAREGRNYLPQVLSEAEAVASHFAATVRLYEENATPDAVIKQCTDRNILHLGCHGAFDQEHPEQSGLMLAGGWLTVRRILTEMQLDGVQICTLGACVSGLAHVAEGDEPIGLAHAMLVAGSQSVVASQWNVQDAATRALFETFYAGIAAGSTPADALYEATRVVRQSPQWQHPYYWAAFQVMGLAHLSTTTRRPINGH